MAEKNKQNNDHEQKPKNIKPGSLKRSSSSDGRATARPCKAGRVNWKDYTTAKGDERFYQCSISTPVIWDNWTATTSSARGEELKDNEDDKSPQVGSEARKRKSSDLTNDILEKKLKCQRYLSSLTTSQTICEPCKEKSTCREEHADLNEEEAIAQDFYVFTAIASNSKATTSDAGCQTSKSPLMPVSPMISFFEPAPDEPAGLEISYFGAGARLEDGTLRPPPEICAPGSCASKDAPQAEKSVEVVKEWKRGGNDPTPQAKQEHTPDDDPKKKNNTDRYLKMF